MQVVAHLKPEKLVITDGSDVVMGLLNKNIEYNLPKIQQKVANNTEAIKCEVFKLLWDEQEIKRREDLSQCFDVVFGSDLIYESENIRPLLTAAKALMSGKDSVFLLSYAHRSDYLLVCSLAYVKRNTIPFYCIIRALLSS